MRALKVIVAAILVLGGGCGALVGGLIATQEIDEWGAGRFWDLAEPEIFLLPEGFDGAVTLVYHAATGEPVRREGASRVYDFRARRVLRLTEGATRGRRRDFDVYVVDTAGRRRHVARGAYCEAGPTEGGLFVCPSNIIGYNWPTNSPETWVVTRDRRTVVTGRLSGDTIVEVGRPMRPEDYAPRELAGVRP